MHIRHLLSLAALQLALLTAAGAIHAEDFFVDANSGNDSSSGSLGAPWRTLGKALNSAPGGSVVTVRAGSYGTLSETSPSGRSQYLTLKGEPGALLSRIVIEYGSSTGAYLRIEGFNVNGTGRVMVYVRQAQHLQIVGCEIHATKWTHGGSGVDGFNIRNASDILVEGNKIYEVGRGMTTSSTNNLIIRRNHFLVKAGSGIQYGGNNANALIEYNHIQGQDFTPYPQDPDAPRDPHASIISIRSSDVTIRGNHMHGMGSSSGMMFYTRDVVGGEDAYSNILIENNALYDIDNPFGLRIYNLGTNVKIHNNIVFSRLRSGACSDGTIGDPRYRYSTPMIVHSIGAGADGSGLTFTNNIMIGTVAIPNNATEGNNVIWAWSDWRATSPSGTSHIETTRYGQCGSYSRFFESGFFANPVDFRFPNKNPVDWTLTQSARDKFFGGVDPSAAIGYIGADGFVTGEVPPPHSGGGASPRPPSLPPVAPILIE